MKIIKSALLLVLLSFAGAFSQPLLPPGEKDGNFQNELNLSDSQKAKIDNILKSKKEKLDKIRNRMMTLMENLRDSTEIVDGQSEKEIIKVLNKEQAEEFKSAAGKRNQFAMMPPPGMIENGFPQNMPGPNHFGQGMQQQCPQAPGFSGQDQPKPDCMGNQDDAVDPGFRNQKEDDIDSLQDLDIFDLMNILE
jgi:hypothetical protein